MSTKGNRKVKPTTILEAIPGSGGIIKTIAECLNVDWHTAKKAIEESPEATQALEAEIEKRADLAEGVIVMNIQMAAKQQGKGYFADTSDAKWYLSKKAKLRGYGEKVEIEHSGSVSWKEFVEATNDSDADTDNP